MTSHYLFITPPLHPIFGVSKGGGLCELPKKIGACGGLSHFVLMFENMPKKSAPAAGLKHMIYTVYEGYYKQNKNYKYTTVDIRRKSNLYYKSELLA